VSHPSSRGRRHRAKRPNRGSCFGFPDSLGFDTPRHRRVSHHEPKAYALCRHGLLSVTVQRGRTGLSSSKVEVDRAPRMDSDVLDRPAKIGGRTVRLVQPTATVRPAVDPPNPVSNRRRSRCHRTTSLVGPIQEAGHRARLGSITSAPGDANTCPTSPRRSAGCDARARSRHRVGPGHGRPSLAQHHRPAGVPRNEVSLE